MDDAAARALITEHFDWSGRDEVLASTLYAEDAPPTPLRISR